MVTKLFQIISTADWLLSKDDNGSFTNISQMTKEIIQLRKKFFCHVEKH